MRRLIVFGLSVLLAVATAQALRPYGQRFWPNGAAAPTLSATESALDSNARRQASGTTRPELPRVYLDTTMVPPSGRVTAVAAESRREAVLRTTRRTIGLPAGGRLQAALDAAEPGDVIELEAGARFVGNFILRNTAKEGWITIRSSAWERLPPPGSRVSPAQAALMPAIVSPNAQPALRAAPGARNIRLVGIEVAPVPGTFVRSLVELGARETSVSDLPADIIIDRCYIHGDPAVGGLRGIALNGVRLAVVDSYLADFKAVGADSQAIMGWNGAGPFKIMNNYLEGAGENVMFGGDDPHIPDLVPSDIEIRGNHFFKPLDWRRHGTQAADHSWIVKNLFELKNARRVLVEGNLFEHNWAQNQLGAAILFTPRNQHGAAPWSVVEDVTFRRNIIRRSRGGFFLLGWDNLRKSRQLRRVLIQDNLFADIGAFPEPSLPNDGVLFLISDGPSAVIIDHNTALQTGPPIRATMTFPGPGRWPVSDFVFTNNIVFHNRGVDGWGHSPRETLDRYFPGAAFAGNALVGGDPALYPPGNVFPPSLDPAPLMAFADGAATPVPMSVMAGMGTDDRTVGADVAAIAAAMPAWWRHR